MRNSIEVGGLHVLVDQNLAPRALEVVPSASVIQLRHKNAPTEEVIAIGEQLLPPIRDKGGLLIINDNVEAAVALGADGVHVGQDDMPAAEARLRIGRDKILGVSATTLEEALQVERQGIADYIGVGPIYATTNKPDAAPPMGIEVFRRICESVETPVIGIGGITEGNASEVMNSGAKGIAVIGSVWDTPDPRRAAQRLRRVIDTSRRR